MTEENYIQYQFENNITITYDVLIGLYIRLFNNIVAKKTDSRIYLEIMSDKKAKIVFSVDYGYKILDLQVINFEQSPQILISENIKFKYSLIKEKYDFLGNRLNEYKKIVKKENPHLLDKIIQVMSLTKYVNENDAQIGKDVNNQFSYNEELHKEAIDSIWEDNVFKGYSRREYTASPKNSRLRSKPHLLKYSAIIS